MDCGGRPHKRQRFATPQGLPGRLGAGPSDKGREVEPGNGGWPARRENAWRRDGNVDPRARAGAACGSGGAATPRPWERPLKGLGRRAPGARNHECNLTEDDRDRAPSDRREHSVSFVLCGGERPARAPGSGDGQGTSHSCKGGLDRAQGGGGHSIAAPIDADRSPPHCGGSPGRRSEAPSREADAGQQSWNSKRHASGGQADEGDGGPREDSPRSTLRQPRCRRPHDEGSSTVESSAADGQLGPHPRRGGGRAEDQDEAAGGTAPNDLSEPWMPRGAAEDSSDGRSSCQPRHRLHRGPSPSQGPVMTMFGMNSHDSFEVLRSRGVISVECDSPDVRNPCATAARALHRGERPLAHRGGGGTDADLVARHCYPGASAAAQPASMPSDDVLRPHLRRRPREEDRGHRRSDEAHGAAQYLADESGEQAAAGCSRSEAQSVEAGAAVKRRRIRGKQTVHFGGAAAQTADHLVPRLGAASQSSSALCNSVHAAAGGGPSRLLTFTPESVSRVAHRHGHDPAAPSGEPYTSSIASCGRPPEALD